MHLAPAANEKSLQHKNQVCVLVQQRGKMPNMLQDRVQFIRLVLDAMTVPIVKEPQQKLLALLHEKNKYLLDLLQRPSGKHLCTKRL